MTAWSGSTGCGPVVLAVYGRGRSERAFGEGTRLCCSACQGLAWTGVPTGYIGSGDAARRWYRSVHLASGVFLEKRIVLLCWLQRLCTPPFSRWSGARFAAKVNYATCLRWIIC
jgi:hypothetical protein